MTHESETLSVQRGCAGQHHGTGASDCPRDLHHHHDERCAPPAGDWHAFVGEPGERTHIHKPDLTWTEARDVLLAFAAGFLNDSCDYCRGNAEQCGGELTVLAPDSEWRGDIDWDELLLTRTAPPSERRLRPGAWAGWTQVGATDG